MSEPISPSPRNAWLAVSVSITAALAVAGFLIGFAWLPLVGAAGSSQGLWTAICTAAGLLGKAPVSAPVVPADYPTTQVEVVPQMLDSASAQAVGRGATLALRCTMCHGARGLSEANSPNLAGQYPIAIYKQLADFKTGARASAVMAPLVAELSDQDMRELAAYYAYLPRVSDRPAAGEAPPRIVESGAPLRGIAPCGACHGDIGSKAAAAWLDGQPVVYLRAQLQAFALGERRNDIGEQMRNVARRMTPEEIAAASKYYADRP
jgi:cytochrome c553